MVAVVTGAASGIGAACVRELRAAGILVAGLDLGEAAGVELAIRVDVADAAAVEAAIGRVERELGPIDRVVTAAGYYERIDLLELDEAAVARMVAVLVDGTANVCRSVLARMVPRGRGSICTIGSELALCGDADAAHYAACKGAVHALAKTIALEVAATGVRVNCVAPGPTDTPLMTAAMRDPAYIASLVLERLVTPAEIAGAVAFVLDADQHNLVGQVISPNAGAVV
jgi:NAD(P)-dependent dehydrogenase (short-subunit alcohol dehydrogenase family)